MIPPEIIEILFEFWKKYRFVFLFVVILVILGYSSVVFLGNDNAIEEHVERMIESEIGIEIDLTPYV